MTPLTLPGGSGEEQPARLGYGRNSAARWPRSQRPRLGSRSSRSSPAPSAPRLRPRPGQAGLLAGPPRTASCHSRCASLGCQRARRCRDRPASWHRGPVGTRPHRRPGSPRCPRDPGNHCLHPGYGAFPRRRMRGQRAEAAASPASAGRDPCPRRGRMGRFAVTRASAPCSRTDCPRRPMPAAPQRRSWQVGHSGTGSPGTARRDQPGQVDANAFQPACRRSVAQVCYDCANEH